MNQDLMDTVLADLVKKRSAGDVTARTVDRYQADPLHCTADSQQSSSRASPVTRRAAAASL